MATLLFRLGIPVDGGDFPTSQQVVSFSYDIILGCLLFCPILPMYGPVSIVSTDVPVFKQWLFFCMNMFMLGHLFCVYYP